MLQTLWLYPQWSLSLNSLWWLLHLSLFGFELGNNLITIFLVWRSTTTSWKMKISSFINKFSLPIWTQKCNKVFLTSFSQSLQQVTEPCLIHTKICSKYKNIPCTWIVNPNRKKLVHSFQYRPQMFIWPNPMTDI